MRKIIPILPFLLWTAGIAWCQIPAGPLNRGLEVAEAGDLDAARELFKTAHSNAVNAGDNLAVAQTDLALLRLLERQLQKRSTALTPQEAQNEAAGLQIEVAARGNEIQQQSALNSQGVIFLWLEMPDAAVDTFQKMEPSKGLEGERFIYLFNYGRALEQYKNSKPGDPTALELYIQSLRLSPEFQPAMDAAMRVLDKDTSRGVQGALQVAEILVDRKLEDMANAWLHYALARWAGQPQSENLLRYLLLHYRNAKLSRLDFEQKEWPALALLLHHGQFWTQALTELRQVYAGFSLDPADAAESAFSTWKASNMADAFSSLLLQIGESTEAGIEHSHDPQIASAFDYYVAAWLVNPNNAMAAARAASLLDDYPKFDTSNRWREFLIQKSTGIPIIVLDPAIRAGFSEYHITLGKILAGMAKPVGIPLAARNSDPCGNESSPRDPLYHWRRAVEIETGQSATDAVSKLPQLNRWLADCYKGVNAAYFKRFDDEVEKSLEQYRQFTPFQGKLRYHVRSMSLGFYGFYAGGIFKSALQAATQQAMDSPPSWGQGWKGFGRRLASSHATRITRQAMALGLDAILKEDPHFVPSDGREVSSRLGNVLAQAFVSRTDRLSSEFAWWRVGSAAASELLSNTWRPDDRGTGGAQFKPAMIRTMFVIGGDTLSNGFREFISPRSRLGRLFSVFFNR